MELHPGAQFNPFKEHLMGMRISSSSGVSSGQSVATANWQQRQQGFKNLMSAVQSGDLASAQKAFAAIGGPQGGAQSNSPLAQIGQALQSGDIAGAQKAAQQLQAQRAGHHHHHSPAATTTPGVTAAANPAPAGSVGGLLNVIA